MKESSLRVSDHAMLRYIERVLDIDLEPVRNEILSKVRQSYAGLPRQAIVKDGFRYIVMAGEVKTVYAPTEKGPSGKLFRTRKIHGGPEGE